MEWQKIDTAPKDATEVIVLVKGKVIRLGWYFNFSTKQFKYSTKARGWRDENGNIINPTHWIPMPSLQSE